jgi:hypothetical protein
MHISLTITCSGNMNIARHDKGKQPVQYLVSSQGVNNVLRCVWKGRKAAITPYDSDVPCVPTWPCSGLLTSVDALEGSCA